MKRAIEVGPPDWKPLECVLLPEDCASFMCVGNVGGIVLYKHHDTRRYLNIDAATGRFYRYTCGDYVEISREEAIEHAYGTIE